MGEKLRILFNSELSAAATGISKLTRELMTRLYNTDKYELAELAAVCGHDDERLDNIPWKVYPTLPRNPSEYQEFNAHHLNVQGRWKFNETCLDFQPNINFLFRDPWLEEYAHYFPFRDFYHLIWWNPVDGEPLEPDWIAKSIEADGCFTYSKWGEGVLREACGQKGNILGAMPLGVDDKVFYPIFNKKGIKEHFGFKDDILVTGFVCRNQPRKLIAVLIESFTKFLLSTKPELAAKCYLYLHTAWPDLSWNIPQLLKDYGIGNKVLFTYQCSNCHAVYPTVYSDIGAVCTKCNRPSLGTARSSEGVSDETMNVLYNFMDCYCQIASNEGLGIPAIEAIACGIVTMVTDYSGMVDIIKEADAIPIKSMKLIREMESSSNRYVSIPDTDYLAQKLDEVLSLPDSLRRTIGWKQKEKGKNWFSWDLAAKIFMEHIDKLPKKDWSQKPFRLHKPNVEVPAGLSVEEIVYFGYNDIIGRPELFNKYRALNQIYNITMGIEGQKPNIKTYSTKQALDDFCNDYSFYDFWERKRAEKFGIKL